MFPILPVALALLLAKVAAETTLLGLSRRQARTLRRRPTPPGIEAIFTDRAGYDHAMDYAAAKSRDDIVVEWVGGLVAAALLAGGAAWITACAGGWIGRDAAWREALVALVVFTLLSLVELPLELWSTFGTEARFGFNRTTPRLWITDKIKGALIALPLGFALFTPLAWFVQTCPDTWWIWAGLSFITFQLLAAGLFPVLLLPLFNKLTPLADESLRTRLLGLAHRAGFPSAAVMVMDGSRRSARANAFFAGFGKMRRIVLFDTLIAQLTPAELEAVLAHEIGHWKRGHILKTMVTSAALAVPVFAIAGWVSHRPDFARALGFTLPAETRTIPFGDLFPLFALMAGVVLYWLAPLANSLSRKHEYEADAYAAEVCGGPAPLISGLRKLYVANSANPLPHPAYALFHHSHPTLVEREQALARSL